MSARPSSAAPHVWVVRAGHRGRHASEFEAAGIAAMRVEPIGSIDGMSREEVVAEAARLLDLGPREAGRAGNQLYRLAFEIGTGDLVVTPDAGTRELLFGEVAGPYRYLNQQPVAGYNHSRPIRWLGRRSRDLLPKRVLYSLGSLMTVFSPAGQNELRALLTEEPTGDLVSAETAADEEQESADLFEDLRSRAGELIGQAIARLDGYETQALLAGILRAMGYHTQEADPGADGGVDVVAARDPLAVEPPIIKVQVKAKPGSRAPVEEMRALIGVLAPGERGVFVSTGGFSRDAEAAAAARQITLIDADRLQTLLLEYYDRLDQDTKSLVPLRRLYFPWTTG